MALFADFPFIYSNSMKDNLLNHPPKYKCKFTLESIDITMNHSYGNKKIPTVIEMDSKNFEDAKLWENKTYVLH